MTMPLLYSNDNPDNHDHNDDDCDEVDDDHIPSSFTLLKG